ncbi:MAG: MBL fold metallo-hydrolase, partial [Clostridiales bacterium]|nr:MBL fold metallo-hydrolase [Candidatus Blautia equi]
MCKENQSGQINRINNTFSAYWSRIFLAFCLCLLLAKCVCADDLTVHFLDVGQGLCIYAESGDETLLYDGGGRDSSSFVVACLKQQNVEKIDYLICSHFDEDHMAGLIGCLHAFEVGSVILPEYQKESDLFISLMSAIAEKQLAVHYAYAG